MRFIALVLLSLLCFSLAACPKKADDTAQKIPPAEESGEGTWDSGE